ADRGRAVADHGVAAHHAHHGVRHPVEDGRRAPPAPSPALLHAGRLPACRRDPVVSPRGPAAPRTCGSPIVPNSRQRHRVPTRTEATTPTRTGVLPGEWRVFPGGRTDGTSHSLRRRTVASPSTWPPRSRPFRPPP